MTNSERNSSGKIPSNNITFLAGHANSTTKRIVKYGNTVKLMACHIQNGKYNFPCFFLTVKSSVSIGQVVATIIPEFETEEMLSQGLQILKSWTPTWNPSFFVTDKSSVELNVVAVVHPKAVRLLYNFTLAQAQDR